MKRASARRLDNLITRLYDSSRLMKMHATVLNAVRRDYYAELFKVFGLVGAGASGFAALAGTLLFSGSVTYGAALGGVTVAGTALASFLAQKHLAQRADYYIEGPGLDDAFRRVHYLQLAEKDEFVSQLWDRVRPGLQTCLRTLGIRAAPSAKRSDMQQLDDIIDKEVPALRRAATKLTSLMPGKNASTNAVIARLTGEASKAAATAASLAAAAPAAAIAAPGPGAAPAALK